MAHPFQLTPWIRLVVGIVGLALAGPVFALVALGPDWRHLRADDLIAFAVLAPFAAFGVLFLAIGLAGRTPRWLPLYEPGFPRVAGRGLILSAMLAAPLVVTDFLNSWLRSRLGLGPLVSWWLAVLPLVVAYKLYRFWAKKRAKTR